MTSKPIEQKKLRTIAYHEAGHAIAAWALGVRFKHVTIEPSGDSLGHVLFETASKRIRPDIQMTPATRHWLELRIVISFAGPEAERLHTGRYSHIAASKDYADAVWLADYITQDCDGGDELNAFLKWMTIRARRLISMPPRWRTLELFTRELLKHRRIEYADAKAFMDKTYHSEMGNWRQ